MTTGPTLHGAAVGKALAGLADLGIARNSLPDARCIDCGFRRGTMPNMTASTVRDALDCLLGLDGDSVFMCHHGIGSGADPQPTQPCYGAFAAMTVPFETMKAAVLEAHAALTELGDESTPEPGFAAWRDRIDPDHRITDGYDLARRFELDKAKGECT